MASSPSPSALYAIRPAKVNWRSSASDKSLPRSRKTPFDLGCSRDTSRGCVGRRCTVLSYTFRSHPYQNTVERGCCSKVFFGLRNNDAGPPRASNTPRGQCHLRLRCREPFRQKWKGPSEGCLLLRAPHPGKPAFHRTKLSLDASHPAKWPFHRMKWHFSLFHPARATIYRTGNQRN